MSSLLVAVASQRLLRPYQGQGHSSVFIWEFLFELCFVQCARAYVWAMLLMYIAESHSGEALCLLILC